MSEFKVHKKIKNEWMNENKSEYNNFEVLYLKLLGKSEKTVDDILLKNSTSKRVNKIYLQAKIFLKIV